MNSSTRLVTMLEVAIMTAVAAVLDKLTLFEMPNGGSITLVMIPIAAVSFRRGVKAGLSCGLLSGLLLLITGGYVVHPVQAALDYPIAFAALGLAGLFRIREHYARKWKASLAGFGLLFAGAFRLLSHFISGVVFFKQYAPAGQSVYLYSLLYNVTYLLPEVIISFVAVLLILYSAPQLITRQS
ncbi:energy-coupled thiamine transporter ThiT [Thermoactinomyces sp. CICC 10523]|uniref:energy-coupled thiamine transporter ThiT n=1 Tax=Thermoactinomyces sp. CICC 10523 TaxID=2767428 RepID=UPI0018DE0375|nr:energy-coupled thiamine transporter ThiT [Thermoactinomyces sp. CICC 10523]MBH8598126.1 energy-coupled thiamine transporter ThiT [Thermoactinomyces sp. CICC 10523]